MEAAREVATPVEVAVGADTAPVEVEAAVATAPVAALTAVRAAAATAAPVAAPAEAPPDRCRLPFSLATPLSTSMLTCLRTTFNRR